MNRIDVTFAQLRAAGRTALIPYVTTGDPAPAATRPIMDALVQAGADIIELGVPFSDPMADGPVIQRASERALAQHVSLADVLAVVADFRRTNTATPVVLMGYANPIEAMGLAPFADRAQKAGVDGVLVVDYPPEEAHDFAALMGEHGIAPIFLLAPTTSESRIAAVARLARGYVYYVSLKGVTGAGHLDTSEVAPRRGGRLTLARAWSAAGGSGGAPPAPGRNPLFIMLSNGGTATVETAKRYPVQMLESGPAADAASRAGAWLGTIRQALDAMERKHAA